MYIRFAHWTEQTTAPLKGERERERRDMEYGNERNISCTRPVPVYVQCPYALRKYT